MSENKPKSSPSPSFCILPWMHMATNTSGQYRVCCHALPGLNLIRTDDGKTLRIDKHAPNEAWNASSYRNLRQQMLRGEEPEMCRRCFREEKAGVTSFRQSMNDRFLGRVVPLTDADGRAPFEIKYLDLRLGNLCNLRCRMCNPHSSNQWVKEWNEVAEKLLTDAEALALGQMTWPENPKVWEQVGTLLTSLEEIYITGGEPMLIKQQIPFLQACVDSGAARGIVLKYNTNLTYVPETLVQLWSHFKEVKINGSIDGYGPMNDFIRYPSKWSVVEKNLKTMIDLTKSSRVSLQVHTTVQAYNLLNLAELLAYLEQLGLHSYLNILDRPDYLNVRILPRALKDKAIQSLLLFADRPKVQGLFRYLEEDWTHLLPRFKAYTETLDRLRTQALPSIAPALSSLMMESVTA